VTTPNRALHVVVGLFVGAALVTAATGVIFGLRDVAPVLGLGVIYLLAIVPAAVLFGVWVALAVSVASMLAFNFFFLQPVHTLRLRETENWVALAVYLAVAIVVSQLAVRARRRAEDAEQRGREAEFAAEVSAMLLEPGFVQDKLGEIGSQAGAVLGVGRAWIELESVRRPQPDELAYPLVVGERRIGQLVLDRVASPDPAALARVLPSLASRLGRRSRTAGPEGTGGREPAPQRRGQDHDPAHARPRPALPVDGDQRGERGAGSGHRRPSA
jgi:two-component system sensor histidine kinase KdpD